MSSSLRRGGLAAAAIAFSIASLAACAAGNNAQTLEVKPDNAATSVGDIKIQNAIVVTQPSTETEGPAVVSATVFNGATTDQTLDSITVDGAGTAELTPAKGEGKGGKVVIPAGGYVVLGGENNASAVLTDVTDAVKDGNAQRVTFNFSETGEVGLRAFVVPAEHYFEKWGPSDIPEAPAASASPSESASGSPSASTSGTPATGEGTTEEEGTAAGSTASPSTSVSEETAGH
ncbi:copper chaperone PCu(A)C [Streptomyces europaeiscabiei]|uniref:Copper chaperone PCu(A)C n=1 Tax=Streptomyces europaeiscabiei TaxID=146819 RepID=A0ABU4NL08_9ACTN|nr:copper chaperone PCu(A)C [Streptomyces europaeiscabiei]MDX2530186.1 copper chaperone PCu(A)C [Streptomyces europaeiscabiei]MDX2765120.1 copper chaperone PCu(A)C [Streptomyces europaeiscabiei]MDX2774576.1 copper chaperone PCu(A)C [Streptomyces europaeiscabiei]MDX3544672.1 copper chaperone PCu(A)C [Streptomyces europaeiscabiei]MDX3554022.1 copper chaperone PCu(A)C [Streptomyces europaeiscabiei]